MKLNLAGSKQDRLNLINILKKYGIIADYMTELMVAQYYNVCDATITILAIRHKKELEKYGYRLYKRSELLKMGLPFLENIPNRGLRLYPIEAVAMVGMLLTESEIAEKVRKDITGVKNIGTTRKEITFINELEDALEPFNIEGIRQFNISSYRIDYYIPSLKIAVEYDENEHKGYSYEAHEGRQQQIEKELDCRFIRVTDKNTNAYNIGLIIKNIFNI